MRLDLPEDVRDLGVRAIHAIGIREEPLARAARDHRGVVLVRREHAARARRRGAPDHREQRRILPRAIDVPVRVEDLVAAVLAVRLREHHELDIGGIAPELGVAALEVLDLVGREREPEVAADASRSVAIGTIAQRPRRAGPRR